MASLTTILTKQPSETRLVSMSFAEKMTSAEQITAITGMVSDPVGLTFASETYAGQIASMLVSGGVIPSRDDINEREYQVTFTVTTDGGQVLEKDAIVLVRED